jgi:hypothetical protein
MMRAGAVPVPPQTSLHFPHHFNNELRISLITLKIHSVTLFSIFSLSRAKKKKENKHRQNEFEPERKD